MPCIYVSEIPSTSTVSTTVFSKNSSTADSTISRENTTDLSTLATPDEDLTSKKVHSISRKKLISSSRRPIVPRKGVNYDEYPSDETTTASNIASPATYSSTKSSFNSIQNNNNDIPKPVPLTTTPSSHKQRIFLKDDRGSSTTTTALPIKNIKHQQLTTTMMRHYKPAVAVDPVSNKSFNSTPVIIGVTVGVVVILAVAILAYKRLQDVWSRRHYARMDYLIDGMYDL